MSYAEILRVEFNFGLKKSPLCFDITGFFDFGLGIADFGLFPNFTTTLH